MIPSDRFYVEARGPLHQGDILLAGVTRLVAEDRFSPPAWDRLDLHDITVADARDDSDLWLEASPALVIVTSHDCHFDKEWNARVRALVREGADQEEAQRQAEADRTLDRTFTASPLVVPDELNRDRGNLMAGRVLGYLPIPPSQDGLVPEAVADLTYRVTLDRLDVVRIASSSAEARMHLRYALAQLDSLRAVSVGFELERVVGRHIERVSFPREKPLFVRLHLDDGSEIDLLQQPVEPDEDAASRTLPPGSAA
jgi:hypothetical protein